MASDPMAHGLLCYCRAGFEPELAAELGERAALAGVAGHARAGRGEGYALFLGNGSALARALPWRELIFARQKLRLLAELRGLDPRDRIAPIIAALQALGIEAQRVPLGVDLQAWPPLAPRARRGGPAQLIHVASLNRVKDQPTLLRALAVLRNAGLAFRMDIVGVDTLQGEMQRLAEQLGLGYCVEFLGFRTQRELRPLMESADLLVMSSLHEAGPLVLLEAAVAGVPTVGTAVGHLVEWSPSATRSVPVGDGIALADAIQQVLADEPLRLRLAEAAQRRTLLEDADCTARLFEALYRHACTDTLASARFAGDVKSKP
jgi:glycosyltransferase involved in cell wall biosynthesis